MNSRHAIIIMLTLGVIIITALTLAPYALKSATRAQVFAERDRDPSPPTQTEREAVKAVVAAQPDLDAATWYAERGEEPQRHGVLIETVNRKKVLASLNPDAPYNPASVTKLATTLAAIKKLGPDYRFETRIFAEGEIDAKGTLQGRLRVNGADPTFGDIGASFIAKELKGRGIKKVRDELAVSPGFSFNFGDAKESAARLAKALSLAGVKTAVADDPPSGEPLFIFKSNNLTDVLLYMNAHSHNFVADGVGALVGGPEGVRRFLIEEVGISADQVWLESCSGLGRNRMTPRGIVTVLRALIEEFHRQALKPEDVMPVATADWGTLRHRLAGTGLEYAVVGKTGTLTTIDGGMACLAGYVYTKDAGMVVFAILDHGNNVWSNRQMEDQLLSEVINQSSAPQIISGPTPRPLLPAAGLSIATE